MQFMNVGSLLFAVRGPFLVCQKQEQLHWFAAACCALTPFFIYVQHEEMQVFKNKGMRCPESIKKFDVSIQTTI